MDDRDVILISYIQQHQHIYDKNSNYFKDKTAVETSWNMIAAALSTTEDDCQRRWCVLRNRYAKERREQSKCKNDTQRKPWPLMKSMSFLDGHVKRRRSYRALSDMQELMSEKPNDCVISKREKWDEIIIDESDEDYPEEPETKHLHSDQSNTSSFLAEEEISIYKPPLLKPPEMQPVPRIIATTTLPEYNQLEMTDPTMDVKPVQLSLPVSNKEIVVNSTTPASEDSNMHFCLSLHGTMQKIPKKFLTKAKIEILQVLDKYENAK